MSEAYFATRPSCGHLVAASVISPNDSKADKRDQAKTVAGWVTEGHRVETLDVEEARAREWCHRTCPERAK